MGYESYCDQRKRETAEALRLKLLDLFPEETAKQLDLVLTEYVDAQIDWAIEDVQDRIAERGAYARYF